MQRYECSLGKVAVLSAVKSAALTECIIVRIPMEANMFVKKLRWMMLVLPILVACTSAPPAPNVASKGTPKVEMHAPEGASGYLSKAGWIAKKYQIAAAHPLATEAGYRILREGGSVVDAAIATQMVLNLVEPQSSGIGGGAFMLMWDEDKVKAFDGRETAPAAATGKLFETADGKPLAFYDAVIGGRSTGVPGVLRMLESAHKQYGKLPWASLFTPAIELAERGFAVSPRLHALIEKDPYLKRDPVAAAYFYDAEGKARAVGYVMRNPALARTLREIAMQGANAFYKGRIASDIVAKVTEHQTNPGLLSLSDMAGYQAKIREPICSDYKRWTVCGMPPPSSGGIAIAQMLGILENTSIANYPPRGEVPNLEPRAEAVHLFSEAGKLAFADRARYVADTDFSPLPAPGIAALIDKPYLAQRAVLISDTSMGLAKPGSPFGADVGLGTDDALEFPGTSQISIVDGYGNALSMTTSIEDAFGSRQMVDGFLLNNQLTDFSFSASDSNGPVANRVEGGKRPRSSMAPTLVFEKNTKNMILAVGSPGGSSIINYVAKVLIAMMDWNMNLQQAIDLPNFGSRNGPTELEQGRASAKLIDSLKAKGDDVRVLVQTSGVQGIMRLTVHGDQLWFAGADPRREGNAKGD